jgi:hypothetical protein
MAPLYLEARIPANHWDGPRFSAFQKELQAHVSHICHLQLDISTEPLCLHNTLVVGLLSPAPTLEYLSVSYQDRRKVEQEFIPDSLFDGTTPRLSYLKLSNCNISWKSPLLKGLKHLKIVTPSTNWRPKLAAWSDALDKMPQLKTLALHSASPIAPPFPFDIEHTVTLPSLTHLDISASPGDCGLALAHLVLLALTWLCLAARTEATNCSDMQEILPYIVPHAHAC